MQTRHIGDITINRVLEIEEPFISPFEIFDDATPEFIDPHRHWLEPKALDPQTGKMILPVQSYLLRTRRHTILIDTCIGCRKSYDGVPEWKDRRDDAWLRNLTATGVALRDIDYVFCTHMHVDHCGWNTQLQDGRWVPTFPNARYIFARDEYAFFETQNNAVFRENVLPVMEAGQAVLVDSDYQLDDNIWLTPTPGHTAGHVAVNIGSQGHTAIMIGDMLHTPLQLIYPDWTPNFDFDLPLAIASRRKFLDTCCDTNTLVLTAHLPSPSVGHVVFHPKREFDFNYL
ncbi:MAG: MBL fold metallo-hydrolase [Rhodobacteraceae bacterium]|nr:MBL fold metallo-hydrolase [Paracoccaceae bacterium]